MYIVHSLINVIISLRKATVWLQLLLWYQVNTNTIIGDEYIHNLHVHNLHVRILCISFIVVFVVHI